MFQTARRPDPLFLDGASPLERATLRLHQERYRLVAEYVRDADVVDCACGTGFGSEMLALAGARSVQGVDLDRGALAFARARHAHPAVTYYEADALRFTSSPAPTVWVSIETVEHLPNPQAYVARVAKTLPAGGKFIASVPVTVSTDGNPHHLRDFTRRSFRRMLAEHGFVEERALEQAHRFALGDVLGGSRRESTHDRRRHLLLWYARHPSVLARRAWLTATKGLVTEYLTIVAVKQ